MLHGLTTTLNTALGMFQSIESGDPQKKYTEKSYWEMILTLNSVPDKLEVLKQTTQEYLAIFKPEYRINKAADLLVRANAIAAADPEGETKKAFEALYDAYHVEFSSKPEFDALLKLLKINTSKEVTIKILDDFNASVVTGADLAKVMAAIKLPDVRKEFSERKNKEWRDASTPNVMHL